MEDRETTRMRKYGESKTTRIMMATVPRVTSGLGLRKFQADGFLLTRVYFRMHKCPHLHLHTVPGSMWIKLNKHLVLVVTSRHNVQSDDKNIGHHAPYLLSAFPLPHVKFMVYILPTDVHRNKNLQTWSHLIGCSNSIHGCIRVHNTLTYTNLQGNYSIWQFWGHQFLKLTECVWSKSFIPTNDNSEIY